MNSFWQLDLGRWVVCGLALLCDAPRSDASVAPGPGARVRLAILGDSLSSGGGVHPDLSLDEKQVGDVLGGQRTLIPDSKPLEGRESWLTPGETLHAPVRVPPGWAAFEHPWQWLRLHAWWHLSRSTLDSPQYTWGYRLARRRGVSPEDLVLGAYDGARSSDFEGQAEAVLDASRGILPETVWIFFTGNDMCASSREGMMQPEMLERHYTAGLTRLLGSAGNGGSTHRIVVLGPLPVPKLVHDPAILAKAIRVRGTEMSCEVYRRKVHSGEFLGEAWRASLGASKEQLLAASLLHQLTVGCATLTAPPASRVEDQTQRVEDLANRMREYRDAIGRAVGAVQESARTRAVELKYLEDLAAYPMGAEDIGQDCFHLSVSGHERLADFLDARLGGI